MNERRPDGQKSLIFLTGFSGTGKSHVGRLVASKLGWDYVDTDDLITQRAGAPIVEIFELGEEHFRKLERAVLAEVAEGHRKVISTGGGVPVDPRNRELMHEKGVVIRLNASPDTIRDRLQRGWRGTEDRNARSGKIRPLLQNGRDDPQVDRIRELLTQREPFYATADVTVKTDGLSPEESAQHVIEAYRRHAYGDAEATHE